MPPLHRSAISGSLLILLLLVEHHTGRRSWRPAQRSIVLAAKLSLLHLQQLQALCQSLKGAAPHGSCTAGWGWLPTKLAPRLWLLVVVLLLVLLLLQALVLVLVLPHCIAQHLHVVRLGLQLCRRVRGS